MKLPSNISKNDIIKAFEKIDKEGIPNDGQSQYYDVIHDNKHYPPKLVVSYANISANGEPLDRNSFNGGRGTESFNLLEKNGFKIIEKNNKPSSFFDQLLMFLKQTTTSDQTTRNYIKNYQDLKVRVSFGQGALARIPWIAFLQKGETVSDGVYPGYLFFKANNILILAYCISETNETNHSWTNIGNPDTIEKFLVDNYKFKPDRYGDSFVFRAYTVDKKLENWGLKSEVIDNELNEIIFKYNGLEFFTPDIPQEIPPYLKSTINSIKTKPFIILAGLSGTGKSRLVRLLAYLFCNDKELKNPNRPGNFELIKVKPNWHDSTELIGYVSRISGQDRYIVTDFLRFIVKAWHFPKTPFFLCLDEMNLAPVEQYFAEYLSIIETRQLINGDICTDPIVDRSICINNGMDSKKADSKSEFIKQLNISNSELSVQFCKEGITLPPNLIVMGTVNMDETTHSFSRKVLDRAMTIEMEMGDLMDGLKEDMDDWSYPDISFESKMVIGDKTYGYQVFAELNSEGEKIIDYLRKLNEILSNTPFMIAYRVRDEFLLYAYNYSINYGLISDRITTILDEMTCLKILPRIEGDEEKTSVIDDLIVIFKEWNLQKALKKAEEMKIKRERYHYTSFWS
jgi:energy-coupling factor transporter ATP-binding protein EcfA2